MFSELRRFDTFWVRVVEGVNGILLGWLRGLFCINSLLRDNSFIIVFCGICWGMLSSRKRGGVRRCEVKGGGGVG